MGEKHHKYEFNYASFKMKPYSGDVGSSSSLLKGIIKKLNEDDFPSDKKVINRHENRKNAVNRKLVIISNRFEVKGMRSFGKIALIKNKAPQIWGGKDIVEEIEKEENKQFIEISNFWIYYCVGADPVVMYEYNHEGPRLSDIEFYLRQIAKEYRIAKNISTSLHLKTTYDQLDKNLQNVFGLTVKVNSANTKRYDWFNALKNLNDDSGFKDVRLEFFYKRVKENGQYLKNIRGMDFARNIISWLKKDKDNLEYMSDLKMSYQVSGSDEIIDLDFLKNKVVSILKIPLNEQDKVISKEFRGIVSDEFNYYLEKGETNIV